MSIKQINPTQNSVGGFSRAGCLRGLFISLFTEVKYETNRDIDVDRGSHGVRSLILPYWTAESDFWI